MNFLIAINYQQKTYIAAPTHNNGVKYGYSFIIVPKSSSYIMCIITGPNIISKLLKSPIIINEDISIENLSLIIFEQLKYFLPCQAIISKSGNILTIDNENINFSQRFSCIGDRSIFGSLYSTDKLSMVPEERIKLALDTIGEKNFELKIYNF